MVAHQLTFNHLKICCWNADELLPKKQELEEFISRQNLDIIAIGETQLTPGYSIKIPNFTMSRADRLTGKGGGTALYIRNHIDHVNLGKVAGLIQLKANALLINLIDNTQVKIISVYGRPQDALPTQDLETLFNTNTPTLAFGDFNAKHPSWNSRTSNRRGLTLLSYAQNKNLTIKSSPTSTFYPNSSKGRPDWLDIVVHNNGIAVRDVIAPNDMSSDHLPLTMYLETDAYLYEKPKRYYTNWEDFNVIFEQKLGAIKSPNGGTLYRHHSGCNRCHFN